MDKQHRIFKRKSNGVTLIEVLVTIVILSIGLLGIAALQLTGLRSVNSASYRTQAAILVNDMAERMRVNRTAVDDKLFMAVDSSTNIDCDTPPDPYCGEYHDGTNLIAAESCSTTELANYDINTWYCGVISNGGRVGGVQAVFPTASATIVCNDINPPAGDDLDDCTDRSPHTITLNWTELNPNQATGDATITQSISLNIKP